MSRRYTDDEKQHTLNLLDANAGDIALTSAQTGIPSRTLRDWIRLRDPIQSRRREKDEKDGGGGGGGDKSPLGEFDLNADSGVSPLPVYGEGARGWGEGTAISADDIRALRGLHDEMLKEAYNLVHSIQEAIDEAPLNQRVAALAQLIDRIIKLSTQLPKPPDSYELAFDEEDEDIDRDDHTLA